jgi:hypothetical protein
MIQEYLRDELRVLNAHLPRKQKSLAELLREEYPHVACNDGSTHLFKRKELEYLASLIDTDKQEALLLPMLVELGQNQAEAVVICVGEITEEVISKVLAMPIRCEQKRIAIYKPQLALLRKKLKTTTQYVFSPRVFE